MSSETIYSCIKLFNARLGDELSLQVGDRIEILADDSEYNDGWYMGRNTITGTVGLFPKSFTKLEQRAEPKSSLLRSRSRRVMTNSSTASANSTPQLASSTPKPQEDSLSTLHEIDKALEELQMLSLDPNKAETRVPSGPASIYKDTDPASAWTWSAKQVAEYFEQVLGFDREVAGKFLRHKITGEILFQLDLLHLKELEIDTFGTRFEIYKEIEKIKLLAGSQRHEEQQLAAAKHKDASVSPTLSKESHQNARLLPSADFKPPASYLKSNDLSRHTSSSSKSPYGFNGGLRSRSMDNLKPQVDEFYDSPNSTNFLSPRKAPEPPNQSPMNTTFKFGGSPVISQQPHASSSANPYMVREKPSTALRPPSSIYDVPLTNPHHRKSSSGFGTHKRHSSVFLFLSGPNDEAAEKLHSQNLYVSPNRDRDSKAITDKRASRFFQDGDLTIIGDDLDIQDGSLSPKKVKEDIKKEGPPGKFKSLRSVSTQNFKSLTGLKKLKTSAFTEGIREINPDEAIKTSTYSGWMSKKSGSALGWRSRYFTLHGTRLSYFTSLKDKREKGLIDITAHRVLPISTEGEGISSNDKYIALYAALTGYGRYCFKIVPPSPGFRKGLTFTQPKIHYFAVETQEEMRGWLKALMTSTIDIDDTVPVVSSCNTPTVTLAKARELLAKAREETKLKDEELNRGEEPTEDSVEEQPESSVEEQPHDRVDEQTIINNFNDSTSEEVSPIVDSLDQTTVSSNNEGTPGGKRQIHLTVDTLTKLYKTPNTPQVSTHSGGFASPYLLATGLLSPKQNGPSSPLAAIPTEDVSTPPPAANRSDYFSSATNFEDVTQLPVGNTLDATSGSRSFLTRKKKAEKMMAYTSDGSFVIKPKKK